MKHATVTPAYGRDYKNGREAEQDWNSGKDFILQDFFSPWDGKPCNKRDLERSEAYSAVHIRYKNMTKVKVIQLEQKVRKEAV